MLRQYQQVKASYNRKTCLAFEEIKSQILNISLTIIKFLDSEIFGR